MGLLFDPPLDPLALPATISPVQPRAVFTLLLALLLPALAPPHAHAQTTQPLPPAPRAFLMTIGPGDRMYELFGHNALIFSDPATGREWGYNWGVFDFNQKNFFWRFLMGRMLYRMEPMDDLGWWVEGYRQDRRAVWIRELDLSPAQRLRLLELCRINELPENRDYRYDYYRDNCSTRVRDILDNALQGRLSEALSARPTPRTFRWHTRRLAQSTPWLYAGLDYVLGHPVDTPLTAWDEGFLPTPLEQHLATLTLDGRPLLGPRIDLVPDTRQGEPSAPPDSLPWYALTAAVLSAAVISLTFAGKWGRRGAVLLVAAWSLLCVLAGGVSTWGWLVTDHTVSRYNENWLQLSPLSLPILLLCIPLLRGKRPRLAFAFALLPLSLSLLGLLLKLLPPFTQPNTAHLLFAIPLHTAVAFCTYKLTHPPTSTPPPTPTPTP